MNPDQAAQIKRLHEAAMRLNIDYIMCADRRLKGDLNVLWLNAEELLTKYLASVTVPFKEIEMP
jgi:hypothetical protein